jgi:hypothetical protein
MFCYIRRQTISVVKWSEFLATDPEARVRFPALREKNAVDLERGPLSLVSTTEEILDRKVACSCLEKWEYGRRDPSRWPHGTPYTKKVVNHFADRRRSLGRYSSLADSDHWVLLYVTSCWLIDVTDVSKVPVLSIFRVFLTFYQTTRHCMVGGSNVRNDIYYLSVFWYL